MGFGSILCIGVAHVGTLSVGDGDIPFISCWLQKNLGAPQ